MCKTPVFFTTNLFRKLMQSSGQYTKVGIQNVSRVRTLPVKRAKITLTRSFFLLGAEGALADGSCTAEPGRSTAGPGEGRALVGLWSAV